MPKATTPLNLNGNQKNDSLTKDQSVGCELATFVKILVTKSNYYFFTRHGNQNGSSLEPCIMSNICYYYNQKIATLCSGVPMRSYRNNLQRNTLNDLTWQHTKNSSLEISFGIFLTL